MANGSIADMAESSSTQEFLTTLDLVMYITFPYPRVHFSKPAKLKA
jgi:hypothetical protein